MNVLTGIARRSREIDLALQDESQQYGNLDESGSLWIIHYRAMITLDQPWHRPKREIETEKIQWDQGRFGSTRRVAPGERDRKTFKLGSYRYGGCPRKKMGGTRRGFVRRGSEKRMED